MQDVMPLHYGKSVNLNVSVLPLVHLRFPSVYVCIVPLFIYFSSTQNIHGIVLFPVVVENRCLSRQLLLRAQVSSDCKAHRFPGDSHDFLLSDTLRTNSSSA